MNETACRLPRTILATVAGSLMLPALAAAADSAMLEFFEKKVRPVLVEHCYQCHSAQAKKPRGGFRVDSRAALLAGGDTGPALVPGNRGHLVPGAPVSLTHDANRVAQRIQVGRPKP